MDDDNSWAEYARIQTLADSDRLCDQTWAADETLEAILDSIEIGQAVSSQQIDNLLTNRAKKQRRRRYLLARDTVILRAAIEGDEINRVEARSELIWHHGRCNGREWRILVCTGLGHTYGDIASAENVPETTIKTWVRRARNRLTPAASRRKPLAHSRTA